MIYHEYLYKEQDNDAVHKLELISRLADGAKSRLVKLTTLVGIPEHSKRLEKIEDTYEAETEPIKTILLENGFFLRKVIIEIKFSDTRSITLHYERNFNRGDVPQHYKELFDYFQIDNIDPNQENGVIIARIIVQANKVFRTIKNSDRVASLDPERAAFLQARDEFNQSQQAAIKVLHDKASNIVTAVADQVLHLSSKLHTEYQNRAQELEQERTRQTKELEEWHTKQIKETEEKRVALEKERHRMAELTHRIVRLNTAKRISKVIRHNLKTVGTTWKTKWKILPPFIAYLALP